MHSPLEQKLDEAEKREREAKKELERAFPKGFRIGERHVSAGEIITIPARYAPRDSEDLLRTVLAAGKTSGGLIPTGDEQFLIIGLSAGASLLRRLSAVASARAILEAERAALLNRARGELAGQIASPGQKLAGQIVTISRMRPFAERLKDVTANPSKWKVLRSVSEASSNIRNKGGRSLQELLRNEETGETIVRHTLFRANGSIFEPSHFRPTFNVE